MTVSSGFGRDPGVAWNPSTNEFGVSFSGETPGGAYSAFAIVPAENPAAFRRTTFNAVAGGLTTITDLQFNPQTQHFVMTWFELTSGYFARIAEFDPTGSLLTQGIVSSTLGSYDSLGLSYNSLSGTFALVGVDRPSGSTDQLLAVELNSRGYRFANEQVIGTGLTPVTYPRVAASQQSSRWFTAFSKGNGQGARYQGTAEVIFNTATASGGPPGEYPGVPGSPTTPSNLRIVISGQSAHSTRDQGTPVVGEGQTPRPKGAPEDPPLSRNPVGREPSRP